MNEKINEIEIVAPSTKETQQTKNNNDENSDVVYKDSVLNENIKSITDNFNVPPEIARKWIDDAPTLVKRDQDFYDDYASKMVKECSGKGCSIDIDDAITIIEYLELSQIYPNDAANYFNNRILKIPTFDKELTFVFEYYNYYYISIIYKDEQINAKFHVKDSLFVGNESRDKKLTDHVVKFTGLDKATCKQLVDELIIKISKGFTKPVKDLKIRYDSYKKLSKEDIDIEEIDESWNTPEIIDKATEILKNGNPHQFIIDTVATMHVGDETAITGIINARMNQSILNSSGQHPKINANSGDGKSHAINSVIKCMPQKYYIVGSFSNKSLFYNPNLNAGTMIIGDDMNIDSELETTLKLAMTNFQDETPHHTLNNDRKSVTMSIPPRCVILMISVEAQGGDELQNRQLGFSVNGTAKQDDAVYDMQVKKAMTGINPELQASEDILICQAMFDMWAKNLMSVVIPFADKIVWNNKSNRRNFDMFLDIIKGFTACNYMQREMNDDGFYIATIEDYHSAEKLYSTIAKSMATKLTPAEMKMAQHLVMKFGSKGATSDEVQNVMELSRSVVERRLNSLLEKLPHMYKEKNSDSISSGDMESRTTTTTTKHSTKYYLSTFDTSNYDKVVYFDEASL